MNEKLIKHSLFHTHTAACTPSAQITLRYLLISGIMTILPDAGGFRYIHAGLSTVRFTKAFYARLHFCAFTFDDAFRLY